MEMQNAEPMKQPEMPVPMVKRSNPLVKALILPDTLLVIQFLLGMYNNFYVKFPEKATALGNWKFVLHSVSEMAHIVMAVILVGTVIMTMVRGRRMKSAHMIKVGNIGLVAVLLAIIGGIGYVTTQNDLFSYLMSIGFLAAIMNVNIGILTMPLPPKQP